MTARLQRVPASPEGNIHRSSGQTHYAPAGVALVPSNNRMGTLGILERPRPRRDPTGDNSWRYITNHLNQMAPPRTRG